MAYSFLGLILFGDGIHGASGTPLTPPTYTTTKMRPKSRDARRGGKQRELYSGVAIGGLSHFWTHMFLWLQRFLFGIQRFFWLQVVRYNRNVSVRPQMVILFIPNGFVPSQMLLSGHKRCCLATCASEIACRLQQHRGTNHRSCLPQQAYPQQVHEIYQQTYLYSAGLVSADPRKNIPAGLSSAGLPSADVIFSKPTLNNRADNVWPDRCLVTPGAKIARPN